MTKKKNVSHLYSFIAEAPSSKIGKFYKVSVRLVDSVRQKQIQLSCPCLGWTRHHRNGNRSCKHTRLIETKMRSGLIVLTAGIIERWEANGYEGNPITMGISRLGDILTPPQSMIEQQSMVKNALRGTGIITEPDIVIPSPCCGTQLIWDGEGLQTCPTCEEDFLAF